MTDSDPTRILIVRPSALGDVCRTVPVLVSLRRRFPEATIDWVVQREFTAGVSRHPDLSTIIEFDRHGGRSRFGSLLRDLRQRNYDLTIDCQGLLRSAIMTWATGAERRVGARGARELAWLFYNVHHEISSETHVVDQMLALLEAVEVPAVQDMHLYTDPADDAWWAERRPAGRYAVLAPTARWASKRWPTECWQTLIGPLADRGFEHVVVIGSPSERDQVAGLADDADPMMIDLVGETSIGQTMAVIAAAGVVVANDSAPLHMAVGFDRATVGLFGPTDPAFVGPYRREESVVRAPLEADERPHYRDRRLGDSLMRRITCDMVLERVDAMLARTTGDDRAYLVVDGPHGGPPASIEPGANGGAN